MPIESAPPAQAHHSSESGRSGTLAGAIVAGVLAQALAGPIIGIIAAAVGASVLAFTPMLRHRETPRTESDHIR